MSRPGSLIAVVLEERGERLARGRRLGRLGLGEERLLLREVGLAHLLPLVLPM